jgi:RNA polymerase sigma factor (sigma-70 family)
VDERAFVQALIARDPAAWRRFADELGPILHRAACAMLRRESPGWARQEAQELVQSVVALLLEKDAALLRSFQGRCRLSTWLIGITRQRLLSHLRRERRPLPPARDVVSEPDDVLDAEEARERLGRAMKSLSPRDRLLLTLFSEETPQAEIAGILGIAVNSVSPLLQRARERVATILAGLRKKS